LLDTFSGVILYNSEEAYIDQSESERKIALILVPRPNGKLAAPSQGIVLAFLGFRVNLNAQ